MLSLAPDSIQHVLSFLPERDFVKFVAMTSRKFSREYSDAIKYICLKILSTKWNVSFELVIKELSYQNPIVLIPHACATLSGLLSDDPTVICDSSNFTATYVGRIGENNRSVQCAISFPPFPQKNPRDTLFGKMYKCFKYYSCSKQNAEIEFIESATKCAYVSPFCYKDKSSKLLKYYFNSRDIFYYEITISPAIAATTPDEYHLQHGEILHEPASFECVAVGLATKFFLKEKRFPGWDNESFGYHGDDGAIFHGRGRQLGEPSLPLSPSL